MNRGISLGPAKSLCFSSISLPVAVALTAIWISWQKAARSADPQVIVHPEKLNMLWDTPAKPNTWGKAAEGEFADKVLLVGYIAAEDAWVISVKPIQILPAFELDVGP